MLLAVVLHKDFADVECVAVASVLSFQSAGINRPEFDTPETDSFSADSDAPFSEQIFDIAMAEVESIVEPHGVGNDVRWESVSFICVH
jgi:hypothetical protein